MSGKTFNVFSELEAWSKKLHAWQLCLLSKVVSTKALSDADYSEVLQEYCYDSEIDPMPQKRNAYVLGLPSETTASSSALRLTTIKNPTGVNALTPGQVLNIGPQLTVIYGPNGSGKSGYARLLKSSCFTRSKSVDVLGDINLPANRRPVPTAEFVFDNGAVVSYEVGKACSELRDHFAVFDSSCIRVYTDERNPFNITPYMFDVFPRMVDAIDDLNDRLKDLIQKKTPALEKYHIPGGKSDVATLLHSISAQSDVKRIQDLGDYTSTDESRLEEVGTSLETLRKADVGALIKAKTVTITDLAELIKKLTESTHEVRKELSDQIQDIRQALKKLRQQGEALSAAKFQDEPVQPVGTQVWKELIERAVAFNAEAYPGTTFPARVEGVRCVLCQQKLDPDGKKRLEMFFEYTTSDIQTQLRNKEQTLKVLHASISKVTIAYFEPQSSYRRLIDELNLELSKEIEQVVNIIKSRKDQLLLAATDKESNEIVVGVGQVTEKLDKIRVAVQEELAQLKAKNVADDIKKKEAELALLSERKILSKILPEVLKSVEELRWVERAKNASPIPHRFITERQKQLMSELVAKGFKERFLANCKRLGLDKPLDFKIAGTEGATNRKLSLKTAGGSDADPSEVLSEGEQTAVALADFLTEVALDDKQVGIIFDDPVSSMDHLRKEQIAKRLVDESKMRQVIVFTHDVIFGHYLSTEAEKVAHGYQFRGNTVSRRHDGAIGCINEVIFPDSHYEKNAVEKAKQLLDDAKKLSGEEQKDKLLKACALLRTGYEYFIQHKLFNDIVGRWRENIKYTLKGLYVDEGIVAQLDERLAVLSRYIEAHSHSPDYQQVPLTPGLISNEIDAYHEIDKTFKKGKEAWMAQHGAVSFS